MKKSVFSLLILVAWLCGKGYSQTIPLESFKEVTLPVSGSKEIYALNNKPGQEFAVTLVKGKLMITKATYSPVFEYPLPEGRLLGVNQGEWGGGLYYKLNDTTIKDIYVNGDARKANTPGDPFRGGLMIPERNPITKLIKGTFLIKTGNIQKVFNYKDSLYTLEGLAHMGLSFGSISKLDIKGNKITGSLRLKFDDAPFGFAIYKDDIYMATLNRFYVIHNWREELILDHLFWSYLYPNSVAVKDAKHIYVGMRAGYAMIDAENKTVVFYQYTGNN
ncbi:hypothetical protein [Mucilaginibacter boryungensis]|uniref:WG repeat protein n=1 Tax=Mucilaginibacter boryungensis TaxID=768480 RepID=A0ABR9XMW0_9SPHI|nr:hypothetical protein [Mucilaginibacter boryungensis]MBE9668439.1 hypothetical protein [Mucilaginibacter boryungensis]